MLFFSFGKEEWGGEGIIQHHTSDCHNTHRHPAESKNQLADLSTFKPYLALFKIFFNIPCSARRHFPTPQLADRINGNTQVAAVDGYCCLCRSCRCPRCRCCRCPRWCFPGCRCHCWRPLADGVTGTAQPRQLWIAPCRSSLLIGQTNFLLSSHWLGQSGLLQVGKIITTEILMTSADSWSDLSEKDMWVRKEHKSSKAVLSQDWCHASGGVKPKHKHGRLSQLSRLFPWRWFFLFAFLGFQSIGKPSCNMASDGWSQGFLIFGLNGDISDPRGSFIWETLDLSGKNFSMIAVSRQYLNWPWPFCLQYGKCIGRKVSKQCCAQMFK